MILHVAPQPRQPNSRAASRKFGPRIDAPAAQVLLPPFATRPITLKYKPERIETRVAHSAALMLAMLGQHLAQRQIAQLRLIAGQFRHIGRRRWNPLAEQPAHDPIAALDRARAQAG